MSELVTIIVPIYNAKLYLKKCIYSILNQTYKNLEIILIDDGSSDNSGSICDRFADKDKRIKVIHKENGGVSMARNVGINRATGEYLCFVDSDDWLPKNSIELLVWQSEKYNADLCMGGTFVVGVRKKTRLQVTANNCISRKDSDAVVDYFQRITHGPWGKLYRTDIIKKNQLEFQKGMLFGEDAHFLWRYIQLSELLAEVEGVVYYYNTIALGSATSKFFEQQGEWIYSVAEEGKKCFAPNDYNNQNVIAYISDYIFGLYKFACGRYINSINRYNVKNFVRNTGNIFKDDLIKYQNTEEKMQFVKWIENDDISAIIDKLTYKKKKTIAGAIKERIKKIVIAVRTIFIFRIMK